MPHRDGKKSRGTHTTCSDLSAKVHDIAVRIREITGVSLGILESGKGVTGGSQKVKIGDMKGGAPHGAPVALGTGDAGL